MAIINKTGIADGGTIQAEHVTRAIDALSGGSTDTIVATGSFSGSFAGNGVGLTGIVSASYATSASVAISASQAVSASFATSASRAISSSIAISSSFATTASYALNSQTVTAVNQNASSGGTYTTTLSAVRNQIFIGTYLNTNESVPATASIVLPDSSSTRQVGDLVEIIFNYNSGTAGQIQYKIDIANADVIQAWGTGSTAGGHILVEDALYSPYLTIRYISSSIWQLTNYTSANTYNGGGTNTPKSRITFR